MSFQGVDYAFPPRPSVAALAAAGKIFACRYGGPGTRDKWLDPVEAASLSSAHINIVANAEGSASGLLNGWSVGASWAKTADAWFRSCGMPPTRPIYLSADFNCSFGQWPAVADALRGAASVIGIDRVGLYGHYNCMRWARRDDVARWFWQTYAWSGGLWATGNHIQQYRNGVTIDGADCDLNEAFPADYGQWFVGGETRDMIPIAFGEGEKPNPPSSRVKAMQLAGVRAGYDLTPFGGADGRYGNGTAGMLVAVLGPELAGDGHLYDAPQYDALQAKAYGGSGGSGTVSGEVHLTLPAITIPEHTVVAPVVPTGSK